MAELGNYARQLRSLTGGQGSFTIAPAHDDFVPLPLQQKIIASRPPSGGSEA
jgi:translation elongation factor EF-G